MSRSVISDESDVHLEDKELLTSKHDGVQESSLMDDSADSDYFTHVDESKPDRSSCELSTFSDCDEEFLEMLNRSGNPSPEPQHVKEHTENLKSRYIPEKEDLIFSLTQADMCLVCIAFASWVLKSSNSQSSDMWKTALLANISAISAIQYLRKYGKGHS
ncbi:hypothetical protein QTP70_026558 [Hemibagrus guttatus]|uniref:Uncharacterized protein n=1 Tax=Hemibagrus guttatus TaxID=175788 RepID=A0AAE0VDK8_9TELE|nr:hypothetical protein QTP70_026558 [Hemibagrus guttatus]